jgi:hypothetical protein
MLFLHSIAWCNEAEEALQIMIEDEHNNTSMMLKLLVKEMLIIDINSQKIESLFFLSLSLLSISH